MSVDKVSTFAARYFGWIVSWPCAVLWLLVCTYALLLVAMDFGRLKIGQGHVFSRDNIVAFAATWLVLKVIHETAHMLFCKRFGGRVGHFGIVLLLLIPLPFVDVSSAWRFPSKAARILTSAAGVILEVFLAALAAIVWYNSDPGWVSQQAANVMVAASLQTLIFNANPLMRFDAYYILADWAEIPNLASRGHEYLFGLGRALLLKLPRKRIWEAGWRGWLIRSYGFASFAWKSLLSITLTLAAANLFQGFGVLLALFAAAMWCALPLSKFVRFICVGNESEIPDRQHFGIVMAVLVFAVVAVGVIVPAPSVVSAPAVVEHRPTSVVRNESSGFVRDIRVEEGDYVDADQVLVVLKNDELVTRLVETKTAIEQSMLRAKAHRTRGNVAAYQSESQVVDALAKQLIELQSSVDRLTIRAPQSGQVLRGEVLDRPGAYLRAGTEIVTIGQEGKKEAIALVSQREARSLRDVVGKQAMVRINGVSSPAIGRVNYISPRARVDLPHASLAAVYGGPLTVTSRSASNAQSDNDFMLVEPRLQLRVEFDQETSEAFRAGQTGNLHLRVRAQNLGSFVCDAIGRWVRSRIQRNHGL